MEWCRSTNEEIIRLEDLISDKEEMIRNMENMIKELREDIERQTELYKKLYTN